MFTTLTIGALAIVAGVQDTDTTFAANGARALELSNQGGQVVVRVWDRDEIRIQADHSRRTYIEIDRSSDGVIEVEPDAEMGPATVVDFQVTIPRSMSVYLEGMYSDIDVDGVGGDVEVETLEGSVVLRNITGDVRAEAITGEVRLENIDGDVEVESVARGVWVTGVSGEVMVESVSGSIHLEDVRSDRVEAGTVSGRIMFSGDIVDGGRYYFGAHSGQIVLALPDGANALVSAVSLTGKFVGRYPGVPETLNTRKRDSFTLGSGGAEIEIETFSGGIVIRRRGAPESEMEMAWNDRVQSEGPWVSGMNGEMLAGISNSVNGSLGIAMDFLHDFEIDLSHLEDMEIQMEDMDLQLEDLDIQMKYLDIQIDQEWIHELQELGPRLSRDINRALERSLKKRHR